MSLLVASSMKTSSVQGSPLVLKPAVLAAVDLHEFAIALAPEAWLMKGLALLPRQPQTRLCHPLADRLTRDVHAMPLQQDLRCKRRTEVLVVLAHKLQHIVPDTVVQSVAGRPASRPVDERCAAAVLVPGQQPLRLPQAHTQSPGGRLRRPPASQHLGQDFDPLQVALAHLHPAQSVTPQSLKQG